MALLRQDGFDIYGGDNTDLLRRWTSLAGSVFLEATVFRSGTHSLRLFNAGANCALANLIGQSIATFIVGFSWRSNGISGPFDIVQVADGATVHLSVAMNSAGNLIVYRGGVGGTVLGTTTQAYVADTFYHIQLKATIHDTTGSFDLRVDEVSVLSATNVDTRNGGNPSVDRVIVKNNTQFYSFYYDDFWVCDTTGSYNNDFLNAVKVLPLKPTANGSTNNWIANTGTNFGAVSETNPDDDSTYVSSATSGDIDLYAMTDLAVSGSIKAVCAVYLARKEDPDPASFEPLVRVGSTNYAGTNQLPLVTYAFHEYRWQINPATSAAWTVAEVNAMEAGIRNSS
jgi:hypothetical protein